MKNGYRKGLVIDKDIKAFENGEPALVYSPERCSFVTHKGNMQYTRKLKKYRYDEAV